MATYNIQLFNIIDSINTPSCCNSNGFLFKYNNQIFLISVHHFKPIINTIIGNITDKKKLIHYKNILWNELQIFNCPEEKYIINIKVIKSYRTRFNDEKSNVNIYINNEKKTFIHNTYVIIYHTPIQKSIYNKILLEETYHESLLQKYKGLSGSPTFDNNDNLIGIFTKIEIIDNKIYGFILPTIYLIRSIDKKDNENLYYLDIDNYNNLKIDKYDISLDENNKYQIYYQPINLKIPLEIFFSIEGDYDKTCLCKNTYTQETKTYEFHKYDNFDISLRLIKSNETFKLNTGLFMYLISNGMFSKHSHIFNNKMLNNIWIHI